MSIFHFSIYWLMDRSIYLSIPQVYWPSSYLARIPMRCLKKERTGPMDSLVGMFYMSGRCQAICFGRTISAWISGLLSFFFTHPPQVFPWSLKEYCVASVGKLTKQAASPQHHTRSRGFAKISFRQLKYRQKSHIADHLKHLDLSENSVPPKSTGISSYCRQKLFYLA